MKDRKLCVSKDLLAAWLRAEFSPHPVVSNAPEDLEVLEVCEDRYHPYNFWVKVRSEQFEDVELPEGAELPEVFFFFREIQVDQEVQNNE